MELPKKKVPATEIKNRLGDYLELVRTKEPVLIERHGKPAVILVNVKDWNQMEMTPGGASSSPWIEGLKRITEKIANNHPEAKPFSAVELIRQIRDEEFS